MMSLHESQPRLVFASDDSGGGNTQILTETHPLSAPEHVSILNGKLATVEIVQGVNRGSPLCDVPRLRVGLRHDITLNRAVMGAKFARALKDAWNIPDPLKSTTDALELAKVIGLVALFNHPASDGPADSATIHLLKSRPPIGIVPNRFRILGKEAAAYQPDSLIDGISDPNTVVTYAVGESAVGDQVLSIPDEITRRLGMVIVDIAYQPSITLLGIPSGDFTPELQHIVQNSLLNPLFVD